jgi:molybdate transport system substrate-binding protein
MKRLALDWLIARRWCAAVGVLLCVLFSGAPAWAADDKAAVTVFGAASLTNVLQDIGDSFTAQTSIPVRFSFAASSALAKQIENGAPADVFFSADVEWMNYLQERNLIQRATRQNALGNRLVLIAPSDSKVMLKIAANFPLAASLGSGKLATGDPDSVPAGRYAKQALTQLGVWAAVADRIARADSVRSALAFVDRGEAPLGIVYETDALVDKNVRIVDTFPADSHAPIIYPLALTNAAKADAAKFVAYVRGPAGDAAFVHYGFRPLHTSASAP